MTTEPLDVVDLLKVAGGTTWSGFPQGGIVGHVHLEVGDIKAADGSTATSSASASPRAIRAPASLAAGVTHHQLAGNVWNSTSAGRSLERMAGLDRVDIVVRDQAATASVIARAETAAISRTDSHSGAILRDPWGTDVRLCAPATTDRLA